MIPSYAALRRLLICALFAPVTALAQPSNDDCSGAIALTVGTSCTGIAGDVAGATESIPAILCGGFTGTANEDVWYSFVATATSQVIEVACSAGFDGVIDLRSGGCDGTNIACRDGANAGGVEVLSAGGLTVGQTYYIRVYDWFDNVPSTTTFTICVYAPQAPSNDDCANATVLSPSTTCDPVNGTILLATASTTASACGGTSNDDVWYAFTATDVSHEIQVATGSGFDAVVELRSGACNGTPVDCVDEQFPGNTEVLTASGLTVGETYYVRVYHFGTNVPANTALSICVLGPEPTGCDAMAGTITPVAANVCLEAGEAAISASPDGNSNVPTGFETIYVLTQGIDLVIIGADAAPAFTVTAADQYTIHTLVYDPLTLDLGVVEFGATTGAEVAALLVQGGGSICASLDVAGAPVTVEECLTCEAETGSLVADQTPVCLQGGAADISATPDGSAVVPSGYAMVYALTLGSDPVIIDGEDLPLFTVNAPGDYYLHTLVFDPATIDLGLVEFGVTTLLDLEALLIQGGGSICGALDMDGILITVEECIVCDADAGTLTAVESQVCLVAGEASISATPDGNSNVPTGFETIYVLTQGTDLVIIGADAAPAFTVTAADQYTIHTLVYDPLTLDLGVVEFGVTTGAEVAALLVQGGGSICASLDVAGAPVTVETCIVCDADAGTLTIDESPVCITMGEVQVGATPNGDAVVPDGFEVAYALTQGAELTIIALNAGPVFSVALPGTYTLHTLVYDPLVIDPLLIELGFTSAFEIHEALVQGGGDICGALDLIGATVVVNDCTPVNDDCGNALPLSVNLAENCPGSAVNGDNTYATVDGGEPSCDDPGDMYLDVWYTFNAGNNTTVTINLDQGTMEDWAIVVSDGCGGNEIACEIQPGAPVEVTTTPFADYLVRVYSNFTFGNGGQFSICLTGAEENLVCDGGMVETSSGAFSVDVCQDTEADVIDFISTSTSLEDYAFFLTDENDAIIAQLAGGSIDFNSAALGIYRVWGVSFNGTLIGAEPGSTVTELATSGSCLDLSDNYVEVMVEICEGLNSAAFGAWGLYPNPNQGDFAIAYSGQEALTDVLVLDANGRIAHQERVAMVNGGRYAISLEGALAAGVYSVRLTNAHGQANMRLVVR
ncbi:MAG: T9SS type A sorting domain-containing protein [Flavobacteriales bacterium]|nr:T9SS type A sorting domain-containing protein [Flavobacteriales bacterium]